MESGGCTLLFPLKMHKIFVSFQGTFLAVYFAFNQECLSCGCKIVVHAVMAGKLNDILLVLIYNPFDNITTAPC